MPFKTTPWPHQLAALDFSEGRIACGLFMEQRTGKTKVVIDNAARLYDAGHIDALIIAAPNGVHRNWLSDEIPLHMPDHVPVRGAYWQSSPRKAVKRALHDLMDPSFNGLRIFTINLEALITKHGFKFVYDFLLCTRAMFVVDESYRIKNHKAAIGKALGQLRDMAKYRRILNGTPNPEGPLDLYGQLLFLSDDALPVASYVAYSNRYADYLPADHPMIRGILRNNPKMRYAPRIIATNPDGSPRYKNLEELKEHVGKWCFRVTRRDCRDDLPEKIYKRWQVDVEPQHAAAIKYHLNAIKEGLTPEPVSKLNAAQYYQRLVCGWIPSKLNDDAVLSPIYANPLDNPRIKACVDIANAYPDDAIVFWARYTVDVKSIGEILRKAFGDEQVVMYFGEIGDDEREEAKRKFQAGESRFFVGQAAAGGVGLPLYRAGVMAYHSNDFKLFTRLQSEDRAEHMEMENGTVIIDIEAPGTIDTRLVDTLRLKKDVSDLITGDPMGTWLQYKGEEA